jgi:hypothetical protein
MASSDSLLGSMTSNGRDITSLPREAKAKTDTVSRYRSLCIDWWRRKYESIKFV